LNKSIYKFIDNYSKVNKISWEILWVFTRA